MLYKTESDLTVKAHTLESVGSVEEPNTSTSLIYFMSGIPETLELEQLSAVKPQAFDKMIH